jgi:hypothetical protein
MKDFEELDKAGNLPNIYEEHYCQVVQENLEKDENNELINEEGSVTFT